MATMGKLATKPPQAPDLYETDLHLWTIEQARLLREGRFAELDLTNLIDEVESVGGSQKQEIENRLDILIAHLLKWRYQPGQRSSGWDGTIREQRRRLARVLKGSPSLRRYPAEVFTDCYLSGRLLAAKETGIDVTLLPEAPPFTAEQALSDDFLPKEAGLLDQS
jgi:ribosomal protein L29